MSILLPGLSAIELGLLSLKLGRFLLLDLRALLMKCLSSSLLPLKTADRCLFFFLISQGALLEADLLPLFLGLLSSQSLLLFNL